MSRTHSDPPSIARASDPVLRDLIDTLVQERLFGLVRRARRVASGPDSLAPGEFWCRIDLGDGWLCWRARESAALQPWRLSRGPIWHGSADRSPEPVGPAEVLRLLAGADEHWPGVGGVLADLGTAVEQAAVVEELADGTPPRPQPGGMLAGERLAVTRGRPFHPTARAVSGWTAAEYRTCGPLGTEPLGLDWVAVRRTHLRLGAHPGSARLHESILTAEDRSALRDAVHRKGLSPDQYQPLPVHPWQSAHVLPGEFGVELSRGDVVEVARGLGAFRPTASLRTLTTWPETHRHVKLPLGVATLGATRLLPPRYLDNGDRAQHTMTTLLDRDPVLGKLATVADESAWVGWQDPSGADEFADRPGHLAAQVRTYPAELLADPAVLLLPMAALATPRWDVLAPALGLGDRGAAVDWFGRLADAFVQLGLSFLRYGVLPELHGQNVVVAFRHGVPERFVLRDHDTLRLFPGWLTSAGVPDPAYRIRPGARQSLRLDSAEALLGYLQTLGFQVNLFGIADALVRWSGVTESVYWSRLGHSVRRALDELDLPAEVADLVRRAVLDAPLWPARRVLEPLLRQGNSIGVSMPADVGTVPNPLTLEPTRSADPPNPYPSPSVPEPTQGP